MGYGKTDAVAENTTSAGRSQNRRVDVKMIVNRGMSQTGTGSSQAADRKSSGRNSKQEQDRSFRFLLLKFAANGCIEF
jgi:hypothetical protein